MARYLTEVIGTFFLVLVIGLVVTGGAPLGAVAIGCVLMVMVYMGGHVSGAHYNPAVTLAVFLRGKLPVTQVAPYMAAQIVGSLLAAFVTMFVMGKGFAVTPGEGVGAVPAVLLEVLATFALALVVLNVATSEKTKGNSYYGLAIGFTVLSAAISVGPVSGGALNPAVAIGPAIARMIEGGEGAGAGISNLWIYIVGPLAGGAAAAMVFKMQESDKA